MDFDNTTPHTHHPRMFHQVEGLVIRQMARQIPRPTSNGDPCRILQGVFFFFPRGRSRPTCGFGPFVLSPVHLSRASKSTSVAGATKSEDSLRRSEDWLGDSPGCGMCASEWALPPPCGHRPPRKRHFKASPWGIGGHRTASADVEIRPMAPILRAVCSRSTFAGPPKSHYGFKPLRHPVRERWRRIELVEPFF